MTGCHRDHPLTYDKLKRPWFWVRAATRAPSALISFG